MRDYQESVCRVIKGTGKKVMYGAEVGVHKGSTSKILLRQFSGLVLFMVDRWSAYPLNHPYRKRGDDEACKADQQFQRIYNMAFTNAQEWIGTRAVIIRKDSYTAASKFDYPLDFVFIDACHYYEDVLADSKAWHGHVAKINGRMIWHDYGKPEFGVTRAVDEFCEERGYEVHEEPGSVAWAQVA
jgi:hypothetical protein